MANNVINYALRENLLTADPDDCMAQVVDARAYTQDDITKEMVKRGTSLTEADIAAYQKLEVEVYKDIIAGGGSLNTPLINTPLINTSFSITGVFTSMADSFDKSRHAIKLNVNAGAALKEAAAQAKAQKTEAASTDPYITSVTDKVTGDSGTVKTGSVMELTGSRLKFDASDAEQGVFALTANGMVRCEPVIENKPARLLVMLPASVEAGEFTVEVRTKIIGATGKALKTMKRGSFGKTLVAVKG